MESIEMIRKTWQQISADPRVTSFVLYHHITTLAPKTMCLFSPTLAHDSVAVSHELIAAIDQSLSVLHDLDAFVSTLNRLRSHPNFASVDCQSYPAINRALLFSIWELCERAGVRYSDERAKAFSSLWDSIIEPVLLPDLSDEERKKNKYFHRRAPESTITIESPEALAFRPQLQPSSVSEVE